MTRTLILAGAAGLTLGMVGSPVIAETPVLTQVAQLIQAETCEQCAPIEMPAEPASPAKRKIKISRLWSTGVLH